VMKIEDMAIGLLPPDGTGVANDASLDRGDTKAVFRFLPEHGRRRDPVYGRDVFEGGERIDLVVRAAGLVELHEAGVIGLASEWAQQQAVDRGRLDARRERGVSHALAYQVPRAVVTPTCLPRGGAQRTRLSSWACTICAMLPEKNTGCR